MKTLKVLKSQSLSGEIIKVKIIIAKLTLLTF